MSRAIREGYVPGCIGRIVELHGEYYHRRAGFGVVFESGVATELARFCGDYSPGRDGLWLATADGRVEGSIAIDGSRASAEGAQLRWFITSDSVRGKGIGTELIGAAVEFCRARRYRSIHLWTFEGLDAARHLYEKFGFRLAAEQRGARWGREVNEQRFEFRC